MIPSKTFYYVRHGRTDANAQSLMCGGSWDISLNAEGFEQAQKLAPSVVTLDPKIERIFVSPMLRAQQTTELLNVMLKVPVTILEGLREWKVGIWEGRPWGEVPNPFNTTEEPEGGESRSHFEKRVEAAVTQALQETTGTPLIVAHGAVAHALFTVLGADRPQIENCGLYLVAPVALSWNVQKIL